MKKLGLSIVIALAALLLRAGTNGWATVEFRPSPSEAINYVSNYFISYGQVSRGTNNTLVLYTRNVPVAKPPAGTTNVSVVVTNLGYGPWFFSAYAVATNGEASSLSNEGSWTNKTYGPTQLRVTGPEEALLLQTSDDLSHWRTVMVITQATPALVQAAQPRAMFRTLSIPTPPPIPK